MEQSYSLDFSKGNWRNGVDAHIVIWVGKVVRIPTLYCPHMGKNEIRNNSITD
jgi:hypothetical protein